jgi:transposase
VRKIIQGGYALWYKRLEEGTFKLPKVQPQQRSVELRPSELAMLLDGIDLRSVRRVKRYRRQR